LQVLVVSLPVIALDEVMKLLARNSKSRVSPFSSRSAYVAVPLEDKAH
jgi:hypothetical protein